jgi:hypothetical protein
MLSVILHFGSNIWYISFFSQNFFPSKFFKYRWRGSAWEQPPAYSLPSAAHIGPKLRLWETLCHILSFKAKH